MLEFKVTMPENLIGDPVAILGEIEDLIHQYYPEAEVDFNIDRK